MKKTNNKLNILLIIFGILVIVSSIYLFNLDTKTSEKTTKNQNLSYEIISENLDIPWEIEFLPNNEMLITERPGTLVRIDSEDKRRIEIEGVEHRGEGGLLGLALHPDFKENNFIYLYLTSNTDGKIENRVEKYKFNLEENKLENKEIILSGIPGASYHDGGRIKFGPEGYLYITTGDAGNSQTSQNTNSLAGKILRITDEGKIPEDNPFGNEVYSYGHRNPQGLTWDNKGNLWSTEHGRSGIQSGYDELNLIEKGENYGWPEIQGDETKENMKKPRIHSGSSETWAPAGATYHDGNIYFTGLRGETLYKYDTENKNLEKHFTSKFGRLRAITIHENNLYISTSNTDGRGNTQEGDDKIIRIELF